MRASRFVAVGGAAAVDSSGRAAVPPSAAPRCRATGLGRRWLLAAVVLLGSSGCSLVASDAGGQASASGDYGESAQVVDLPDLTDQPDVPVELIESVRFPLDGFRPTSEQRGQMLGAIDSLVAGCAAERGVVVQLAPRKVPQDDYYFVYEASVRPLTADSARAYGYHMPPTGSPGRSMFDGLSPSALEIVGGWEPDGDGSSPPSDPFLLNGGCYGQARAALAGTSDQNGIEEYASVVDHLIMEAGARVQADPRFLEATESWAECMAGKGYPGLASTTDAFRGWELGGPIGEGERAQALADAACKDSSGLARLWAQLTYAYQVRALDDHADQLASIRSRLELTMVNTSRVLSGATL